MEEVAKADGVRQRILATGFFVAGLCKAGGSRWAGVTTRLNSPKSDPGYSFRERMPESVGAPKTRLTRSRTCWPTRRWRRSLRPVGISGDFRDGQNFPVVTEGVEVGRIAVADVLA